MFSKTDSVINKFSVFSGICLSIDFTKSVFETILPTTYPLPKKHSLIINAVLIKAHRKPITHHYPPAHSVRHSPNRCFTALGCYHLTYSFFTRGQTLTSLFGPFCAEAPSAFYKAASSLSKVFYGYNNESAKTLRNTP